MGFKRQWDACCPRVWDQWESDGKKWTIQDLPPEDDEKAVQLMIEDLCPDEVLCASCGLTNDRESITSLRKVWLHCMSNRMSLACYAEAEGSRELASVNVCIVVSCTGKKETDIEIEGKAWKTVYTGLKYPHSKIDVHKYLGVDSVLEGMGLVVKKAYRGARLGARMLAARKGLCESHGIKATSTVFTGIASQKLADRCGFKTIVEVPIKELAENGLDYSKDDKRSIKLMVLKYV